MKKTARIVTLVLSIVMLMSLVACGDNGGGKTAAAKTVGVYLSPAKLSYNNMRPQYNYYLTNFTHQELTLLDDNTYCLIVSSSTFSALELAESTNDAKGNERDNAITKYYGTYTSKVNDLDDDLLDVTLSAPTRVVKSYDQNYWLDTDNWTDAMGKAVNPPLRDPDTGATSVDPNAEPMAAKDYLASVAFSQITVQVNQKTFSFDYEDTFKA